jgi:hypothetical protein
MQRFRASNACDIHLMGKAVCSNISSLVPVFPGEETEGSEGFGDVFRYARMRHKVSG